MHPVLDTSHYLLNKKVLLIGERPKRGNALKDFFHYESPHLMLKIYVHNKIGH